jgi:iron complex transport system substrate-binding protein
LSRRAALALALSLGLAACGAGGDADRARAPAARAAPLRVVSLDYCADQYLLELLPRERIAALSPDADRPFSYHRARAAGLRQVPSRAEDVLVLRPDLVVRSYGGGPDAARFFAAAGVPVLQIGYAEDLAGVRRTLVEVAAGLGLRARGEARARQLDARLARIGEARGPATRTALYLTSGGATAGPGTLVHELIVAAGLRNFEDAPGWHALPLERLARARPDLVAPAFFGAGAGLLDGWSAARHPVAQAQLRARPVVPLDGAWTACGGWFVLDAVEALAKAAG